MDDAALFIADLHLTPLRPQVNRIFFRFTGEIAPSAGALYVLGDLFEYWIGDDDLVDAFAASVVAAFRRVADAGTRLHFMVGNRDFLIGERFAEACGGTLLADPFQLDLFGTRTLLMHGDTLCTDDVEYMQTRTLVRLAQWQTQFLAQSRRTRHALAREYRERSEQGKQEKASYVMDANAEAIAAILRQYGYPRLIHGHTHRPARHLHEVDGHVCERWVLPDWYENGGYLRCDAGGCALHTIEE